MKIWILLVTLLLITGCKDQVVYSSLDEKEANEMVSLLLKNQIEAYKTGGREGRFSVTTKQSDYASAVDLLSANGLPRPKFDSLGKVFEEQGFVSSRTSQRSRYIHALSQEIAHTISSIDGVLLARVHLSVPEAEPLADRAPDSSASVFVKHRADVDLSVHVGKIKALVINGLENLPYDNVTVALFAALPPVASTPNDTIPVSAELRRDHAIAEQAPMNSLESSILSVSQPVIYVFSMLIALGVVMSTFLRRKKKGL